MTFAEPVVLGTRGSKLALVQAESCAEKLRALGLEIEVRAIKTTSEHHPNVPLSVIDQRDVFTRQLDEAVHSGEIDLAVHSLKDIPTEVPEGIRICAVTERHDPADALVSDARHDVDDLKVGAIVATSSLRRRAQLLYRRPDLRIVEMRGNVGTRIRKMREGQADAVVLARAGLQRLDLDVAHTIIPLQTMVPAVGQGALGIAVLKDHRLRQVIREALNHELTERATSAERAMLRTLEGGCRVPVGGHAVVKGSIVRLVGLVASTDGALVYKSEVEGEDSQAVGEQLAQRLIEQGAGLILAEIKEVRA
ncbi:hydroxymethylbilane synthase [soil metagenome]